MPEDHRQNPWNRLLEAAKDAGATEDHAPVEPAPSGFVARIIAMRQGLWKFARTFIWRRWSLVAALLAIALYLVVYFVMKSNPPTPAPTPPPSFPFPPEP
ncbi:MAG: hypothetical protein GWO24_36490 [Akkermansiaceae bacterium]|nr:hypothetical protein [Akkermansiaceae bacterium]